MKDDLTKDFFSWLDASDVSIDSLATSIDNSTQTISTWRSRGIPKGKRFACEAFMKEELTRQAAEAKEVEAVIPVKVSRERFRNYNEAARTADLLMEDWMITALDKAASEEPLVSDIGWHQHPPLKKFDSKVAEDAVTYGSKPTSSDGDDEILDQVVEEQYLEHQVPDEDDDVSEGTSLTS